MKQEQIDKLLKELKARKIEAKQVGENIKSREILSSEVRAVDDEKKMITICFTSEGKDRHGTILVQKGMKTNHFKKNPVFAKNHENKIESALGNVKNIRKDEKDPTKSLADFHFDFDTPFGETAYKLYKNGTLRAVSVGFMALAWEFRKVEDKDKFETLHFTKWELTEVSAVLVPSNRDALKKAIDSGVVSEEEARGFEADSRDISEGDEKKKSVDELRAELNRQIAIFTKNHETTKFYRKLLIALKKKFDQSDENSEIETIEKLIELVESDTSDYNRKDDSSDQEIPDEVEAPERKLSTEEFKGLLSEIL